mmetsp:Transcript_10822/g.43826  ORF Transcript_10822/g.43826 Transcript_10822/m.43826 type:complete len:80 (+) Transcript_10822:135-374(+)
MMENNTERDTSEGDWTHHHRTPDTRESDGASHRALVQEARITLRSSSWTPAGWKSRPRRFFLKAAAPRENHTQADLAAS